MLDVEDGELRRQLNDAQAMGMGLIEEHRVQVPGEHRPLRIAAKSEPIVSRKKREVATRVDVKLGQRGHGNGRGKPVGDTTSRLPEPPGAAPTRLLRAAAAGPLPAHTVQEVAALGRRVVAEPLVRRHDPTATRVVDAVLPDDAPRVGGAVAQCLLHAHVIRDREVDVVSVDPIQGSVLQRAGHEREELVGEEDVDVRRHHELTAGPANPGVLRDHLEERERLRMG